MKFAEDSAAKKEGRGGHNKEIIMMTIKTFKLMCLKAGTKKSNEIHEYYVKMEKVLQNYVNLLAPLLIMWPNTVD